MLSMQPGAIRVRRHREKQRERATLALPVTSSAPPATSSVTPGAPSPAGAAAVTVTPSPASASLHETHPVTGPGADAFGAPVTLEDEGNGNAQATPLVEPAPPPPPVQTSPEEAALIGKIVGTYVGFGWGLLAQRHADKLIPITETLMRAQPELAALPPEQKLQLGLGAMVSMVEASAARVAMKHNIRVPYQDEGIVGIGVATATLGIVQEFKSGSPRNENAPPAPPAPRNAQRAQAGPERVTRNVTRDAEPADIDLGDSPSARAAEQPVDAEIVLG